MIINPLQIASGICRNELTAMCFIVFVISLIALAISILNTILGNA